MKLSVLASLVASTAAFAPVAKQSSGTALQSAYENELGVIAPTGFFGKASIQSEDVLANDPSANAGFVPFFINE